MKTIQQIKNEIYRKRQIEVETWTNKDCDEYISASPSILVTERTIQEKKELILDLEYNYIQQSDLQSLNDVYDQYPSLEWINS